MKTRERCTRHRPLSCTTHLASSWRAAFPVLVATCLLALTAASAQEPEWAAALEEACDGVTPPAAGSRQSLFDGPGGMIPMGPPGGGDPWAGNEAGRTAWCAAMADTHQADWYSGLIPGLVRGPGKELEKSTDTMNYFRVAVQAFDRLEAAPQPDALRTHAREARALVRCEASVFRRYGWNYERALYDGATLAPPLGVRFIGALAVHVTALSRAQEQWCWKDPRDRG